jgi:hypothetical protein
MKTKKESIQLSEHHPSLLLHLKPDPDQGTTAPLVVDQNGILIDGYRRFQLSSKAEFEVLQISTPNLVDTAFDLNYKTRQWDEVDLFLWNRWATSLGLACVRLPHARFPRELEDADPDLLRLLANRALHLRQAILIQQAPGRYRSAFRSLLSDKIQLNPNETAQLIQLSCDLVHVLKIDHVSGVFLQKRCSEVIENSGLNRKHKGEALLKELRVLRYPYYEAKKAGFEESWKQLELDSSITSKPGALLERGALEILVKVRSRKELDRALESLHRSLKSKAWDKIWEES